MASSEGQTELLTGWSCVVHQPSDDPEPSELPSTVDMAAFSAGLNVEPAANTQNEDGSESDTDSESDSNNSGSDGSGSCSQSDSSDSDSSSTSSTSRSPSPEFAVTSQPNGLRLTIATVRKSCASPIVEKASKCDVKAPDKEKTPVKTPVKTGNLSSSSGGKCTDSESDTNRSDNKSDASNKKNVVKSSVKEVVVKKANKVRTKTVEKKSDKKVGKKDVSSPKNVTRSKTKIKRKKMASLPLSRSSTCSSTDSDESDADSAMLASCSLQLQEIRQEDLAAILPDQQEIDAFGAFEETEKNSPQTGDASGSDIELPQQAVNAIIERTTESSSDNECHPSPNPNTLYTNSLLQQFVAQTQMLNTSSAHPPQPGDVSGSSNLNTDLQTTTSDMEAIKRKRGRPKKASKVVDTKSVDKTMIEYCGDPNVSPDSGIQNSPDHVSSPDCSPLPPVGKSKYLEAKKPVKCETKKHESKNISTNVVNKVKEPQQSKLTVTSNRFDRILYGNTDRVLYPPRRKAGRPPITKKGPGRPPKLKPVEIKVEPSLEKNNIAHKIDKVEPSKTGKNKKQRSSRDKDIIQLTTNTHSLSLGKETKLNGLKEPKVSKATHLYDICERVSKRLELNNKCGSKLNKPKSNKRVILGSKNKIDRAKNKYLTLKNAKLMHSKHRHKKHKKCKFKILKPVTSTSDPKLNSEIDKLIQDFVKLCNISTSKPAKENVPEIIKVLKKVVKKRKASDYSERKKKKISTTVVKETNSNEQRLPLKKRHYHLSTNSDNKPDSTEVTSQTDTENEANTKKKLIVPTIVKPLEKVEKKMEKIVKVDVSKSPLHNKVATVIKTSAATLPKIASVNNNEYGVKKTVNVRIHIEEAIEACINKYTGTKDNKIGIKLEPIVPKEEKINTPSTILTTTTPKKRHRLEAANITPEKLIDNKEDVKKLDEKPEKVIPDNVEKSKKILELVTKKLETVAQINTRKKNRLEDLTSSLVSKIVPIDPIETTNKRKIKTEETNRATVIKYPACKKAKPIESNQLEMAVDAKPTGIFLPTVDLDLHIAKENKISSDKELIMKEDAKKTIEIETITKIEVKTEVIVKKKVRKRRAINRTGFPTIKKKKKKIVPVEIIAVDIKPSPEICDTFERVPKDGEGYSTFVERTEKLNKAALDKLPQCNSELYGVTKWEVLSECDSLPLEDRIDFDCLDVKQERMSLRNRDSSPATSVDTRFSDRIKIKRDCTPELDEFTDTFKKKDKFKRQRELLERKCNRSEDNLKKRLRDVSPASSIEPSLDKRLKDERASASGDETKRTKKAPRWRKKCLIAGLFSDYYKEDDEKAKQKRNDNAANKTKIVYIPAEHPFGLLPAPYHCGKYLRCRKIAFQLPHDLWWQHTHSQLPGREMVPSWNYRKIRTNVYNVKNTAGACEPQACNCNTSVGCGDDCINRLVLAECPASHKCLNQKIQKHEWAPGIEKFMTEFKGWGVRTNLPIKNSEFILEYVGEVVSDQEFKERMATRYVHDTHHYCLHLDGGLLIDGHRMGGDGRFVNHSCEPNCEMQKWSVNGQFRMALFALRDIKGSEELTYDYNFSLFNAAEGQECKCGSDNCRGVIGGKSQRVRQNNNNQNVVSAPAGRVGRPRKNQAAKKALNGTKEKETTTTTAPAPPVAPTPLMKPMSHAQRSFVLERHCFMLRNLKKVKKVKTGTVCPVPRAQAPTPTNQSSTFLNHLNALRQPRNMKTRRFAQAEDDPELNKTVRLATVLRDIYRIVIEAKDEHNDKLSIPFLACPSKRKVPEYFVKIIEPIDLTVIEQNLESGVYKTSAMFDADMIKLFTNVCKFYGRTSELGISATRLKKIYNEAKQASLPKFENVLGVKAPAKFTAKKKKGEEEDVIRCICGMYRDEGLMIQCERCLVWQHSECVQANADAPSYHCEKCVYRDVDYEIKMDEFTEHGHQYYMTLMRGKALQLRQGDTVYVLRDIPIPGSDKKHTYDTIGKVEYENLDIFRVERLWKDSKTGQRFAYGHHFLRPHETYHEPTRKFFPNEVMRVPLYEAVPVELVISHCWVMDLNTYCKGRPIGAPEEHIYICEYRVDKSARLFSKVARSKFPTCTKNYAFERFDTRLKISRTYTPHDLDPSFAKQRGRKPMEIEDPSKEIMKIPVVVHVPVLRTRSERKSRLNGFLLKLLSKLPTKQTLDVSYLLEGGRRRKKQT